MCQHCSVRHFWWLLVFELSISKLLICKCTGGAYHFVHRYLLSFFLYQFVDFFNIPKKDKIYLNVSLPQLNIKMPHFANQVRNCVFNLRFLKMKLFFTFFCFVRVKIALQLCDFYSFSIFNVI